MQKVYLILIALVFVLSILFALLILWQTVKVEKKAIIAKRAKEKHLMQLMLEQEEEERKLVELKMQEEFYQNVQAEAETKTLQESQNS